MTAGGMWSRIGEPLRGSEVFLLPTGGLATPGYSWMTPPGSPAQLPDLTACLVLRGQESGPAFGCCATPKKINPHA